MAMCDDAMSMGGGGGKMPGITLIIIGGKPPMPPGHSLSAPSDNEMAPHVDLGGDDAEMAPPKDAAPAKRQMMNVRSMNTKREVMKPRGL